MANFITPEELRACSAAPFTTNGEAEAYERAAATIEALQAEVERLTARGADRDGLAAIREQARAWAAGQLPTFELITYRERQGYVQRQFSKLSGILSAAPSVSLAHVKAETLREEADRKIESKSVQIAAHMPGTQRILRDRAAQIESEASN